VRPASYTSLDEALEILSAHGPELRNGLTSHAPMAAEALCAMGRPEAVLPWLEAYRKNLSPRPSARERIGREGWRSALARPERFADWSAFFAEELREAPWREVLGRWAGRLAPGICADATHGVIRVGHAARSLAERESPLRLAELADGLAGWAAGYQELPTRERPGVAPMHPRDAIARVALVPPGRRRFSGTIVSSLEALGDFPDFAPAIGLLDVGGDPARRVWELAEVFARVYLANARDELRAIVFVHGVTSVAALASLLPLLDDGSARAALRFAWQAGCALYASFGSGPPAAGAIEAPREDVDTLVDMAIAHGDEHAIKFTEACLRAHAHQPSPALPAAARHALDALPPA